MAKWKTRYCSYLKGLTCYHLDDLKVEPWEGKEDLRVWVAQNMKRAIQCLTDLGVEKGVLGQVNVFQYGSEQNGDKYKVTYGISGIRGFEWSIVTDTYQTGYSQKKFQVGEFAWEGDEIRWDGVKI